MPTADSVGGVVTTRTSPTQSCAHRLALGSHRCRPRHRGGRRSGCPQGTAIARSRSGQRRGTPSRGRPAGQKRNGPASTKSEVMPGIVAMIAGTMTSPARPAAIAARARAGTGGGAPSDAGHAIRPIRRHPERPQAARRRRGLPRPLQVPPVRSSCRVVGVHLRYPRPGVTGSQTAAQYHREGLSSPQNQAMPGGEGLDQPRMCRERLLCQIRVTARQDRSGPATVNPIVSWWRSATRIGDPPLSRRKTPEWVAT